MKSKKERLKEQSLKQIEQKRKAEREEEELRQKSSSDEAVGNMTAKLLKKEPVFCLLFKILAAGVYLYSCFFYGGVTVIGILYDYVDNVPHKYAFYMLAGVIILLVSLFLMFFKKYIVSFVLNILGTILYMKTSVFLVERVRKLINNTYIADPETAKLDKVYIYRHYPELAFLAIGFILLAINLTRRYLRYRRIKAERDNAPVKSIIED